MIQWSVSRSASGVPLVSLSCRKVGIRSDGSDWGHLQYPLSALEGDVAQIETWKLRSGLSWDWMLLRWRLSAPRNKCNSVTLALLLQRITSVFPQKPVWMFKLNFRDQGWASACRRCWEWCLSCADSGRRLMYFFSWGLRLAFIQMWQMWWNEPQFVGCVCWPAVLDSPVNTPTNNCRRTFPPLTRQTARN